MQRERKIPLVDFGSEIRLPVLARGETARHHAAGLSL